MLTWKNLLRPFLIAPLVVGLVACGGDEKQALNPEGSEEAETVSRIEGEVFYRERIMLPPDVEVEVQLQDVSKADALASVMASVHFNPQGGPPYPFSIEYDPADIDERMSYSLRATISRGDQLMFTSTEFIDPFSGDDLRILVQKVPEPVEKSPASPPGPADDGLAAEKETEAPSQSAKADDPTWVLATLGAEQAPLGAGGKAIELVLNAQESTASGFSGCNRYRGSFDSSGMSRHGTPIKFGLMASTMMACADGDTTERAYLQMLGAVDAYRMQGDTLALLQGEEVVATFELR